MTLPLWVTFLAVTGIALHALEIGYLLGRRQHDMDLHGEFQAMSGSLLGLLAFILAMTSGGQVTRFAVYGDSALHPARSN
jgi:hypothetical protein